VPAAGEFSPSLSLLCLCLFVREADFVIPCACSW
jgi:hypothetical protein